MCIDGLKKKEGEKERKRGKEEEGKRGRGEEGKWGREEEGRREEGGGGSKWQLVPSLHHSLIKAT